MTTRFRWRGLELPGRVQFDPKFKSTVYGRLSVEPFEKGFGTTVGNSIRRVLLSSLEGAPSPRSRSGRWHEFSSLPGVMEDATDIVLNVKNLIVQLEGDEPKTMRLAARGPGVITADMIQADTAITILNTPGDRHPHRRATSRWSSTSRRAAATSPRTRCTPRSRRSA